MPRVVHFEIPVDDADRARTFYRTAFDWQLVGHGESPYWLASTGGPEQGGIDGALTSRSDVHAAPVLIVDVPDLDDGLRRAQAAGASLVHARHAVPGIGWSAYVRDTEGNVLGLWQSDPSAG